LKFVSRLRAIIIIIGLLPICLFPVGGSPVYPVKISSSNPRILVDQNNIPFLMTGDSPQSLIANLSFTNAAYYVADRATNGFNTLLIDAICTTYTFGRPNASLVDGTLPFTNTIAGGYYDLTTPNPAYFSYVDKVINLCASNGIQVMLDPIETGGWLTTMLANGTTNCRAYGQYLGNRYQNFPNIIWSSGNDFQQWSNPANDAVVLAVASGIKDYDTNHLQTIELQFYISSSLDDTNWAPIVGLNAAYTYSPTYAEVLHAYNQSSTIPTFMVEANYEYETNPVTDGGSPRILRMQEYWTMLSGATGQLYGNFYSVRFPPSGWQNYLDSVGVTQLGYMANLFGPRAWYNLVPDQTHVFVTAGYGQFTASGFIAGNNYVTAALTPDGSFGIAYLPQGGTITVAMTNLQSNITARWFDPSANTFTNIAGSPFSNTNSQNFTSPGNNSAGNSDWVLLLESGSVTNPVIQADLGLAMTGPNQTVIVNYLMTYSVTVTNPGPNSASNVMLTNTLPPGVIPISPTNQTGSSNLIINLGTLAPGSLTNLLFTVEPTNVGVLFFSASVGAPGVLDTNAANNFAGTNITVTNYLPGTLVAFTNSPQIINFQNALTEQSITLSNAGASSVPAAMVVVTGLTNQLFNAVGTNNGSPLVYYSASLAAGQSVSLLLQYYPRGYFPFDNSQLSAFPVPLPNWTLPAGTIDTNLITRMVELTNGDMLLEWPSTVGKAYTVVYSDNTSFSNAMVAPPAVMAPANWTQWIDYGPPTTVSTPASAGTRYYRVFQNP
jgi:uncharacterized repeat protein (TIGR01451 family)